MGVGADCFVAWGFTNLKMGLKLIHSMGSKAVFLPKMCMHKVKSLLKVVNILQIFFNL